MNKEEMKKKFIEFEADRVNLIGNAHIEGITAEDDESDKVVAELVTLNRKTLDVLINYLLDSIQPFSEISLVWWAVALEHMGEHMQTVFNPRQKVQYMLIKETMTLIDSKTIMVDMSQFPGGAKDGE